MFEEKADAKDELDAVVMRGAFHYESCNAQGEYTARLLDSQGNVKWEDQIHNVVCTVGKNAMLDAALAGSNYTVTGPYMGLISSVSFTTGPAASDTMASHPGWYEAGTGSDYPLYTAPRKTCAWNAANLGAKALSSALNFPITFAGTVKGCFIVFGAGASATIADTGGYLWSAGLFTAGDKLVGIGDTLQVSYSASL